MRLGIFCLTLITLVCPVHYVIATGDNPDYRQCEINIVRTHGGVEVQFNPPSMLYSVRSTGQHSGSWITPACQLEVSRDLKNWLPVGGKVEGGIGRHPELVAFSLIEGPDSHVFYRVRMDSIQKTLEETKLTARESQQVLIRNRRVALQSSDTEPVIVPVSMTVFDGIEITRKRFEIAMPVFLSNQ